MGEPFAIRPATVEDAARLEQLIPLSVRGLQAPYYTRAQMEASLGPVFGVDTQLLRDGTYFVAESGGELAGGGGWSFRQTTYGGDRGTLRDAARLDPARDAARIRAFFVHPGWARRGLGAALLRECEQALQAAGFRRATMVATLAGEPLYARFGYAVEERYEAPLEAGLSLPVVRMSKTFQPEAR